MVCCHWTGGTYASAVDWCCRDESDVSYHVIIARDGAHVQIVNWDRAAYAMGVCRTSDPKRLPYKSANEASDNLALAGGPPTAPTAAQIETLTGLVVERFRARGWSAAEVWRIRGHSEEAVYPKGHPKAGQRGRKPDVRGTGATPWLDLGVLRAEVARRLTTDQ